MPIYDEFYAKACEEAKDDFFMFGARHTDEDVERIAARLREEAKNEDSER